MKDKIFSDLYRQMSSKMEEVFNCSSAANRPKADGMNAKISIGDKSGRDYLYFDAVKNYLEQHGLWRKHVEYDYEIQFTSGTHHCTTSLRSLPIVMYKLEVAFKVPTKDRYKFIA